MTYIDGAILLILVLALVHGFFRGLIVPLICWAFIIVGVVVAFFHPGLAAKLAPSPILRPVIGSVIVVAFGFIGRLVARVVAPPIYSKIPLPRSLDKVGGVAVGVFASSLSIFMLLNSMVTVDRALTPLTRSDQTSAVQIAEIRQTLAEHPELASILPPDDLAAVGQKPGQSAVPSNQIGQISSALGTWQQIHNQMAASRIAPAICAIFDHMPFIGQGATWPAP
ncbi:MAG: CvpA family protein [Candidatus Dormibacteria bacterium]